MDPNKATPPSSPSLPEVESGSVSTTQTSPAESPQNNNDIWASDNEDPHLLNHREELLSDLPTLKRQHMTDGYREGLSISKARVMQSGFDAGYPVGVKIALRVGVVLGVLEGYLAGKALGEKGLEMVRKTYVKAQEELAVGSLLEGIDEAVLSECVDVPVGVERVIVRWEALVLGPWRRKTDEDVGDRKVVERTAG